MEQAGQPIKADTRPAWLIQEEHWVKHIYQGDDAPQLTLRAAITGMLLGGVMSLSNLYVVMKTGWSLGVSITSCILAFFVFSTLERISPNTFQRKFSTLENYTAQSAATAAAVACSAGLAHAVPALYMVNGVWLESFPLAMWITGISFLGVIMAVPMKRQMINIEQLTFPSGIATAETLKSLHGAGAEAMQKARALLGAGILGAVVASSREIFHVIKSQYYLPFTSHGVPFSKLTVGFEGSLIMVAAGAIMGMRVAVSMLIGSLFNFLFLVPRMMELGVIPPEGGLRNISSKFAVWPGVAIMVSSSLLAFAFQWRTIGRAFSGVTKLFSKKPVVSEDPLERIEVPGSWFIGGFLLAGGACVAMQMAFFQIHWWMAILAVLMTFVLCLVAGRATGETDITPTGALGKITQLTYGVISPGNIVANLMTANVTSGCASHCSDLLTDLKSGYILGANPRRQFLAQFCGVIAGSFFAVPAYQLLITPENLGSDAMPAPAAKMWAAVAQALSQGLNTIHPLAIQGIYWGLAVGAIIVLLGKFVPKTARYLPSPTGLGLAFVVGAYNSISMFIGALIVYILARKAPEINDKYTVPVASGIIAGESLMGVLVAALIAFGLLS